MTLKGFYQVSFHGPLPGEGGMVIADGETIRGWDSQFLYAGTYSESGGQLTATVSVKPRRAGVANVFGTSGALSLTLSGTGNEAGFSLSGTAAGLPGTISIAGRQVAPLSF